MIYIITLLMNIGGCLMTIVYRFSRNRIFIINEYWIFVPISIGLNYIWIRRIIKHKKRLRDIQAEKLRKISNLAMQSQIHRGGDDFLDVSDIKCLMEEGVSYLDDKRLVRIIETLFKKKMRRKILYIIATAICTVHKNFDSGFLSLPLVVGDFGLTSIAQTLKRLIATVFLSIIIPLILTGGLTGYVGSAISLVIGSTFGFSSLEQIIPMTRIVGATSIKNIKPRIPNFVDLVVINNKNQLIMSPSSKKVEYWLGYQALFNPDCQKPTQIPTVVEVLANDISYNEVVNMKDVTALKKFSFSDVVDMGKQTKFPVSRRSAKLVKFLDKFGNSDAGGENIDPYDITNELTKIN